MVGHEGEWRIGGRYLGRSENQNNWKMINPECFYCVLVHMEHEDMQFS